MKTIQYIIFLFILAANVIAQSLDINKTYKEAMTAYEQKNYKESVEKFTQIFNAEGYEKRSVTSLYNGACVYALVGDFEKSLEVLDILASKKFYSNVNHISNDSDLYALHSLPGWFALIKKIKHNEETQPERIRDKIKTELIKCKLILENDDGKLWGEKIWSDAILVLDNDNTIYSLQNLPESDTRDSVLFFKKVPDNSIYQSNTTQKYYGKEYAIVLTSYLNDSSSTIIHELFHLLQLKHMALNGNPIDYLDNYDARLWLRLEYQALRNTLQAMMDKKDKFIVNQFLNDALLFRKIRQTKYKEYLTNELEIETLEGIANYTGHKLSSNQKKYNIAIIEINLREQSGTFTRSFAYATGLAYGLIFDYLIPDWKSGLDIIYNFLNIYESKYLKNEINITESDIEKAYSRNNYGVINNEELNRKQLHEKNIAYYTDLFVNKPTLTVLLDDSLFSRTLDMNGTLVLENIGMVYTFIIGKDESGGKNFGSFKTLPGKNEMGVYGILGSLGEKKFTFPLPNKIDGNKIFGDNYEIEINDGWEVQIVNEKGDLKIVKNN